jgi:hypothetical protein
MPELAVLSALSEGPQSDEQVLRVAGLALASLGLDRARPYWELLSSRLGDAMLRAVEGVMTYNGEPLSELSKKYFREGKAEGKAEGLAQALLHVLAARSFTLTPEERAKILACTEAHRLERWIEQAVTARSVAGLLK